MERSKGGEGQCDYGWRKRCRMRSSLIHSVPRRGTTLTPVGSLPAPHNHTILCRSESPHQKERRSNTVQACERLNAHVGMHTITDKNFAPRSIPSSAVGQTSGVRADLKGRSFRGKSTSHQLCLAAERIHIIESAKKNTIRHS